jgi:hypothetical protein
VRGSRQQQPGRARWTAPRKVQLERGRIIGFARSVGEASAVLLDAGAAIAAGHPDVPLLPTYLFTLESEHHDTLAFLCELSVDPDLVLHGEQEFVHMEQLFAGQEVSIRSCIIEDRIAPEQGLRFLKRVTEVTRDGRIASLLTATWVIRCG